MFSCGHKPGRKGFHFKINSGAKNRVRCLPSSQIVSIILRFFVSNEFCDTTCSVTQRPHTFATCLCVSIQSFIQGFNPFHNLSKNLPPFKYCPLLVLQKNLRIPSSLIDVSTIIFNFIKEPLISGNPSKRKR